MSDLLRAASAKSTLANFIASNIVFESDVLFGYLKPMFRAQFPRPSMQLRYNETLRIGEDYIFFASALAKRGAQCVVEPTAAMPTHPRGLDFARARAASRRGDAGRRPRLRPRPRVGCGRADRAGQANPQPGGGRLVPDAGQHIKARAPLKAVGAALRDPAALRHLRMPIAAGCGGLLRCGPAAEPRLVKRGVREGRNGSRNGTMQDEGNLSSSRPGLASQKAGCFGPVRQFGRNYRVDSSSPVLVSVAASTRMSQVFLQAAGGFALIRPDMIHWKGRCPTADCSTARPRSDDMGGKG